MKIKLSDASIDAWQELHTYESSQDSLRGQVGAACVFVGTMRDFNMGDNVSGMYLEHYPEMTTNHMEKIAAEAQQKWDINDVFMLHRYGEIQPADTIVVLAVWSAHRDEAFAACRYLIEELKTRAPFWKKETLIADSSQRWVNGLSRKA